jgi:hypothetical protein
MLEKKIQSSCFVPKAITFLQDGLRTANQPLATEV